MNDALDGLHANFIHFFDAARTLSSLFIVPAPFRVISNHCSLRMCRGECKHQKRTETQNTHTILVLVTRLEKWLEEYLCWFLSHLTPINLMLPRCRHRRRRR